MNPRLLSMKDAAKYLGVSYWTVRDWCLAGRIPIVRLPPLRARAGAKAQTDLRRVLIDRDDIDRFLKNLERRTLGEDGK